MLGSRERLDRTSSFGPISFGSLGHANIEFIEKILKYLLILLFKYIFSLFHPFSIILKSHTLVLFLLLLPSVGFSKPSVNLF